MRKRLIFYLILLISWLIVCGTLFFFDLMDLIGILVSFLFSLPTMIFEFIEWAIKKRRDKKLYGISILQKIIVEIDNRIHEAENLNYQRKRKGMPLINVEKDLQYTYGSEKTKSQINIHIRNVFGKKAILTHYDMLLSRPYEFHNELKIKLSKYHPTQEEILKYSLTALL